METGTVKWFNRVRGYGFILPDGGGQDVFVHYTGISGNGYKNLWQGERVSYILVDNGRGPQTVAVKTTRGNK